MHRIFSLTIVSIVVASAAWAGPGKVEAYTFKFDGDNGPVAVELNSETMGFGLRDLAPGDVRTTVSEDGTSVTISRLAESYSLAVGDEVFEIPAHDGPPHHAHHRMMMHHASGDQAMIAHHRGLGDGLTIISREPLDETTRATIRDALNAAGVTQDLNFLSPGMENLSVEEEIDADGTRMDIKRVIRVIQD